MVREIGLDDDFSGVIASPGSSGHLGQQLKSSLGSPEIGQSKSLIGRQHTDRMVLDLAAAWERLAPWPLVAP